MKHLRLFIIIISLLLPGSALIFAETLDLPVKTIKGRDYYYYTPRKGDTIYGISKLLGISTEDIILHNPDAANGVHKGKTLFFPYEAFSDQADYTEATDGSSLAPDTVPEAAPLTLRPVIALMLPFDLENEQPGRMAQNCLDFYKGILIAADSLNRGDTVEIHAFDTRGDISEVERLMREDSVIATAAVIIPPDDAAAIRLIARAAADRGNYVFNVLNIQDSLYMESPAVVQANISQRLMYEKAIMGIKREFPDHRPVILRSTQGRNEKESFVAALTASFMQDSVQPIVIEYRNALLTSELEESLPMDNGQRYVVIPSSGSLTEFNKFAYVLRSYRDHRRVLATEAYVESDGSNPAANGSIEVFGYPDWTAFRGDALDLLHKLDATVYSRFYDNFTGTRREALDSCFKRWFGSPMLESVPTYGTLGFDTGYYIIRDLRYNDGSYSPLYPGIYSGVQSTFDFERYYEGGYINTALYIIRYMPSGKMSAIAL